MPFTFVSWEGRPALYEDPSTAWFIRQPGKDWERAEAAEVADSGAIVKSLDSFQEMFPDLPPFPMEARHLVEGDLRATRPSTSPPLWKALADYETERSKRLRHKEQARGFPLKSDGEMVWSEMKLEVPHLFAAIDQANAALLVNAKAPAVQTETTPQRPLRSVEEIVADVRANNRRRDFVIYGILIIANAVLAFMAGKPEPLPSGYVWQLFLLAAVAAFFGAIGRVIWQGLIYCSGLFVFGLLVAFTEGGGRFSLDELTWISSMCIWGVLFGYLIRRAVKEQS